MVEDTGPDGVEDRHDNTAEELLPHSSEEIGQEDGDVEAWEVACTADDYVADGGVPEGFVGCVTGPVADLGEDYALV